MDKQYIDLIFRMVFLRSTFAGVVAIVLIAWHLHRSKEEEVENIEKSTWFTLTVNRVKRVFLH